MILFLSFFEVKKNVFSERNEDLKIDIERSEISGIEYGLWVFLESQLDDYYYNILPAKGFKVLIYTASDYPDAPSGGLREVLVSPRSEIFLNLNPTSFYSSPVRTNLRSESINSTMINISKHDKCQGNNLTFQIKCQTFLY